MEYLGNLNKFKFVVFVDWLIDLGKIINNFSLLVVSHNITIIVSQNDNVLVSVLL